MLRPTFLSPVQSLSRAIRRCRRDLWPRKEVTNEGSEGRKEEVPTRKVPLSMEDGRARVDETRIERGTQVTVPMDNEMKYCT